jgi:hypothetical protein
LNRQLKAHDIFDEVFPVVQLRPCLQQVSGTGLYPNGCSEGTGFFPAAVTLLRRPHASP